MSERAEPSDARPGDGPSASGAAQREGGPSPYELVFGDPSLEARLDEIAVEARDRETDVTDPERFVMLAAAGALLRELRPEDEDAQGLLDLGRLLFQAYHFRLAGRPLYALEEPLARGLLAHPPTLGEWSFVPPAPAGYLRLPRHLLWARVAEATPPEAVDGVFWTFGSVGPTSAPAPAATTVSAAGDAGSATLHALLVLGLRADRPGFSVAAVSAPLPGGHGHWGDLRARAEGPDFGNILPGGELRGLHGLVTEAEVLRLLSLCFHYVAAHPETVRVEAAAAAPAGEAARAPGDRAYRVAGVGPGE